MDITGLFSFIFAVSLAISALAFMVWLSIPRKKSDLQIDNEFKPLNLETLDKLMVTNQEEPEQTITQDNSILMALDISPYKKCFFCKEEILLEAIKCKHCRSFIFNINLLSAKFIMLFCLGMTLIGLIAYFINFESSYNLQAILESTLIIIVVMGTSLLDPITLAGYLLAGIKIRNIWLSIFAGILWCLFTIGLSLIANRIGHSDMDIYVSQRLAAACIFTLIVNKIKFRKKVS